MLTGATVVLVQLEQITAGGASELQVNEDPPLPVRVMDEPWQMVVSFPELARATGWEMTLTVTLSVSEQIPLLAISI